MSQLREQPADELPDLAACAMLRCSRDVVEGVRVLAGERLIETQGAGFMIKLDRQDILAPRTGDAEALEERLG